MAKNVSVGVKYEPDEYGFQRATTRDWTDEEVAEAVAFLKQKHAKIWAELVKLEPGDLRESEAALLQSGALFSLHPECELSEITSLERKVRQVRWAELGLEF